MSENNELREQVRSRYAGAARAVASGTRNVDLLVEDGFRAASCCGDTSERQFGSGLYDLTDANVIPVSAVEASLGCGNPTAVAELREGERVLDLGSGGGIDVLLAAKRVGPTGFVYGVDMTDEMLELAERNRAEAQASNVEFLKGDIEDVPLTDAAVGVVISNCTINLSTDKPAVFAELFRVLKPGGRICISDVVAEDGVSAVERAERGSYAGCMAGALSRSEYLGGLGGVGFVGASVEFTREAADGVHAATIRATKPAA